MENDERTKYVPMGMNMTLQEIADEFGTSRERISQIEKRALGKLKRELTARGYNAEDFIGQLIDTPAKISNTRTE